MSAPAEIIALLESVVGIYFSGVRHRERAAFILCDELVEMACKVRAREQNRRFDTSCSFFEATGAPGVELNVFQLGKMVNQNRQTRNQLQHGSAAATVDDEHCASAIAAAVEVVDHCWPGSSSTAFKPWLVCALRIVKLYSSGGQELLRQGFEDAMRDHPWGDVEGLKANEVAIRPGLRQFWQYTCTYFLNAVEEQLDAQGVD